MWTVIWCSFRVLTGLNSVPACVWYHNAQNETKLWAGNDENILSVNSFDRTKMAYKFKQNHMGFFLTKASLPLLLVPFTAEHMHVDSWLNGGCAYADVCAGARRWKDLRGNMVALHSKCLLSSMYECVRKGLLLCCILCSISSSSQHAHPT